MNPWMLVEATPVTKFEYYFACTCNGVHLYFITSPGKMTFALRAMNVALTVRLMVSLSDNENIVISCFLVNSYN